jgi:hypothetical protein
MVVCVCDPSYAKSRSEDRGLLLQAKSMGPYLKKPKEKKKRVWGPGLSGTVPAWSSTASLH